MRKRSLAFKMMAGGALLIALPLMVIGWFVNQRMSTALTAIGREKIADRAGDLAAGMDDRIRDRLMLASALAADRHLLRVAEQVTADGPMDAVEGVETLRRSLQDRFEALDSGCEEWFLADAGGSILTGVREGGGEVAAGSIADLRYFQEARRTQTAVMGEMARSEATGRPILVACAPLFTGEGRFVGALGISLVADRLTAMVSQTKIGATGYPYITDAKGTVIAHPKAAFVLDLNTAALDGMADFTRRTLTESRGTAAYVFKGVHKTAAFATIPSTGWKLVATQNTDDFMAAARAARNVTAGVTGVFLTLALAALWGFARTISKPLDQIAGTMDRASAEVASASGQVSSASQDLAEGASKQAASIEETSSSLEEMSSMTRRNAANARAAEDLMKIAGATIEEANRTMDRMTVSMRDISRTGEETQKIVRTIDEIAFQTNLLALNAAVEAARAGEAGAGFAVVADEVRNLALRAAEAAKNTSGLIESSVRQITEGAILVDRTNKAFDEVAGISEKVSGLIGEMASASSEQAQGVEQINQAVVDMDKVVQQNAATAEESASAAEEMNAQAEKLRASVRGLVSLVKGARGAGDAEGAAPGPARLPGGPNPRTAPPDPWSDDEDF